MRRKAIWAAALLAAAPILGCAEQPLPTEDTPLPAFDFTNGPANPGPIVVRFDNEAWGLWTAAPPGLSAFHGFDVTDFAVCGGSTPYDTIAIQLVFPPHNEFNQLLWRALLTVDGSNAD